MISISTRGNDHSSSGLEGLRLVSAGRFKMKFKITSDIGEEYTEKIFYNLP